MNIQTFTTTANAIHNSKYDYSKVSFKNQSDIITIICPDHGEFQQRVSVHIKDRCGCKKCGLANRKLPNKKTKEQFVQDARSVHGERYDYSDVEYKNANTDVLIKCSIHGEFKQRPSAHITQKQGCPKCGLIERQLPNQKTTEQFANQAKTKWGETYDYTNTKYINKETKISYICREHGEIEQKPYLHLKSGCPYCAGRGINKYDTESFIAKAKEVHGDSYDYSKVKINSINDNVTIICSVHGEFEQKAANHINLKNGCPKCMGGKKWTNNDYIEKAKEKHGDKFDYSSTNYNGAHATIKLSCPIHGEFTQYAYTHLRSIYACPICAASIQSSKAEKDIAKFIKEHYQGKIETNNRTILDKQEIDIFLPEIKLGIEFNGNYWHSEAIVDKNYHFKKAIIAANKKINLIQIFEYEWDNKKDIVKSRLLSAIGANNKIHGRKTKIIKLTKYQKNNFLERTHIQGMDGSAISFGLIYQDKIVACMAFGKPRFNQNYEYELTRYSSDINVNVVGGASKLFSAFMKEYKGSIISYADKRWGTGSLYENLGFVIDGEVSPSYVYYHLNKKIVLNWNAGYKRHILAKMPIYDESLSEYEIMKLNGYERIWNAGHVRWVMK